MAEIIDFSKYKDEIKSRGSNLFAFLKEKGADDELVDFAEKRSKELGARLGNLGQYRFPITLPDSLTVEEQRRVVGEIKAGMDQANGKLEAVIQELAALALVAELKVFQYERICRNGF